MNIELEQCADHELRELISKAKAILRFRSAASTKTVSVSFERKSTDRKSRTWAKTVEKIDPLQCGAYAIQGPFVSGNTVQVQEGAFLLIGGSSEAGKTADRYYILIAAEEGQHFESTSGRFAFSGSGARLVTSSKDQVNGSTLKLHPDLGRRAGEDTFPILVALREAGF
jgi:hypothetical protein